MVVVASVFLQLHTLHVATSLQSWTMVVDLHLDPAGVSLRVPGVRHQDGVDGQHQILVLRAQGSHVEAGVNVVVEVRC